MAYSFSTDDGADFAVQTMLGGVAFGLGDVGEILQTVEQIPAGDDTAWSAAFRALAQRVETIADTARRDGCLRSGRDAYLRAAVYYAAAQDGELSGTDDDAIRRTFRDHRRCWDSFADLNEPTLERVAIPYDGSTMPGYFLPVDGTRRPTVVVVNGSDGALTWVWSLAQAAHDYGFNALLFDGPGQQSMLFERQIPFRPDWEAVITPVIDFLLDRAEVDPHQLVLYGGSQAGFWVPRALAFEHRFAAAVADPGVVDVSASWMAHLPKELIDLLDTGDAADFNAAMTQGLQDPGFQAMWNFRARPYGTFNPYDVFTKMRQYNLTGVAGQITTPLMISDPEGEQFWPGQSRKLAELVSGPSHLVAFTADEGADRHCEPLARTLLHQRMFDWLATVLPARN
ncbi:MAG: hypothetical protein Q8P61_00970 [Candidatus Nanopelagicales bacterium]|nr:hypothetical protein [Candidatus Nanopelagicales bacterium]